MNRPPFSRWLRLRAGARLPLTQPLVWRAVARDILWLCLSWSSGLPPGFCFPSDRAWIPAELLLPALVWDRVLLRDRKRKRSLMESERGAAARANAPMLILAPASERWVGASYLCWHLCLSLRRRVAAMGAALGMHSPVWLHRSSATGRGLRAACPWIAQH